MSLPWEVCGPLIEAKACANAEARGRTGAEVSRDHSTAEAVETQWREGLNH